MIRRSKVSRLATSSAIIAAGVLVLAACGGETTTTAPSAAAPSAAAPAASEAPAASALPATGSGELHLYSWTDYIDPAQLDAFTAETGIQVILDTYDSNETMLAKIQAGATGYDVLVPSDYMVAQMIELGLLENIGVNTLPNAANIKPNLIDVYWDPGRSYSAPYMYGTTGIGVDTTDPAVSGIASWKDYFAAGSVAGNSLDVLKDQTELVSAALRAGGVAPADLCSTDKAQYAAAQELLSTFKPKVIDSDGGIERMVKGSSKARMAWNGSVHRMTVENPNIQFVYPSDGLNLWADNFVVPVGAPDLENAKIFINWMMSPEQAGVASNFSGYDNGIIDSDPFMNDSLKTDPGVVVPADKVALISPTPSCGQEARDLYTEVFTSWQSGQ